MIAPDLGRAVLELATDSSKFFSDLDRAQSRTTGLRETFAAAGQDAKRFSADLASAGGPLSTYAGLMGTATRQTSSAQAAIGLYSGGVTAASRTTQAFGQSLTGTSGAGALMGWAAAAKESSVATSALAQQARAAVPSVTNLTSIVARYAGPMAALYAIKNTISWSDNLKEMGEATGISTTRLQQLTYAASQSGVSFETLVSKLGVLNDRVGTGDQGTASALLKLGLTFKDLKSLSPDEQFVKIAEATTKARLSGQELTSTFNDLYGKGAHLLIPMAKDLNKVMGEAPVLTEENIQKMSALNSTWDRLVTSGKVVIGTVFGPIAGALAEGVTHASRFSESLNLIGFLMNRNDPLAFGKAVYATGDAFRYAAEQAAGYFRILSGNAAMTPNLPNQYQRWFGAAAMPTGVGPKPVPDLEATAQALGGHLTDWNERSREAAEATKRLSKLIDDTVPKLANSWTLWSAEGMHIAPPMEWWQDTIPKTSPSGLAGMPMPALPTGSYGYPVEITDASKGWWRQNAGELSGVMSQIVGAGIGGGVGGALGAGAGTVSSMLAAQAGRANPMTGGGWGPALGGAGIGLGAGMTGYALGSSLGKGKGIAAGALSGAAQGAMMGSVIPGIGTVVGGVVGGVAGVIGGFLGAGSAQRKAGKEADAAIKKQQEDLLATYGSLDKIRQMGKAVGVDLAAAWGDKNVKGLEHFTQATKDFTKALDKAKQRLDTISTKGLLLDAQSAAFLKTQSPEDIAAFVGAQTTRGIGALGKIAGGFGASGLAGVMAELEQAKKAPSKEAKEEVPGLADLAEGDAVTKTQQAVDDYLKAHPVSAGAAKGIGGGVAGLAAALEEQGLSPVEIAKELGPTVTALQKQFEALGVDGGKAFTSIAGSMTYLADETVAPLIEGATGAVELMTVLANTGRLDQETFAGLATAVSDTAAQLTLEGKGGEEMGKALQPQLQRIWELQQQFGYSVDESTQALINQAVEAGTVGEQFKSPADKMLGAIDKLVARMGDFIDTILGVPGAISELPTDIDLNANVHYSTDGLPGPNGESDGTEGEHYHRGGIVMHRGGLVGAVPWHALIRAHDGMFVGSAALAADEVSIIARRNEGILSDDVGMPTLSRWALAAMNRGQGPGAEGGGETVTIDARTEVTIAVQALDADDFATKIERDIGPKLADAIERGHRGLRTKWRDAILGTA